MGDKAKATEESTKETAMGKAPMLTDPESFDFGKCEQYMTEVLD